MGRSLFILILVLIASAPNSRAEDLDVASASALADTKSMLGNPKERSAAVAQDPNAVKADQNLKSLGLSQDMQEAAYRLTGDLTEKLVQETGGDPAKLQLKLQELMRNPASLEGVLNPEQHLLIQKMGHEAGPAKVP
jgi:hypothetical protein